MDDRSFAERLGRESERWVAGGILSPAQAEAIRARHPVERVDRRDRATQALALIGAIAVGVGAIGFVAANWDGMPDGARLALLTLVVAGLYAGAYELRDRRRTLPHVGEALYLTAVLAFGASLFLVGQMYDVEAHDPLALLLWSAGAVATSLVVRSRAIAFTAVILFSSWVGFEVGLALERAGDEDVTGLPLAGALYGAALYAAGTAAIDRFRAPGIVASGFPQAARFVGLPVAATGLFVFTFEGAVEALGEQEVVEGTLLALLLALAGLALGGAALVAAGRRPTAAAEALVLAASVAVLLAATLAGGRPTLYALVVNLLFAVVAVGLVWAGYAGREPWLVNLGVALVAVDLVARYFDLFWDALPRSLGMIGAGLLVLGIAWVLERQRKRLLARMAA